MTAPGVGPLVAIMFKTAVDDPARVKKSKAVGAPFGLTSGKYQSGETDVTGAITRVGDEMVRTALYEAANTLLSRVIPVARATPAMPPRPAVCAPAAANSRRPRSSRRGRKAS
jgi:transposase